MLKAWFPEGDGEFFDFMARQCHSCKLHKSGGGKVALGQHWCKLLWGGLNGSETNLYSRAAWVHDATMGKTICRSRQPKPAPKPRSRKPDPPAQITMEL